MRPTIMKNQYILLSAGILLALATSASGAQEEMQTANATTLTKKLFTYAGPLLPSDWSLVSILSDRVVIGFNNGSARNSLIEELEPKDRSFVQRLQNGTVYATPLSSAKEKLAQWSSSVTSTVTKFGKSVKEQFDSFVNNNNKTMTDKPSSSIFDLPQVN